MPFETHPQLIAITLFALALVILSIVRLAKSPNSILVLLVGIALVGLSAWMFQGLNIMNHFFDALSDKGLISSKQFNEGKQSVELWIVILPAVVAAIGANLITSWAIPRD